MDTILALREKRKNIWESAKAFLDTVRDENGLVSAENTERYEKMENDVVQLGKEIERLERQQAMDAILSKPTSQPIIEQPGNGTQIEKLKGRASQAYAQAFWNSIRHKGFIDVQNALSVGTDSDGGYLVPEEYEKTLVDKLQEENFFRKLGTVIHTSGDRKIPVVTGHGEASWMEENGLYPDSQDTFGQQSIGAYKLGTAIRVSEELLNDSAFDVETYIANEFARRIGTKEEEAFLIGDGKSKPTGVFGSAELGVTAGTTSITFDDVIDLYHSLRTPYRKKAAWILNDSTVKTLRKLKDNNGNYIWQPSVTVGTPDTILNRPCYSSSFAPELAAGKRPLIFGDFSYYWIADREYRSFKRLNELYAANGQIGFLASQRVDGLLMLKESVKALEVKAKG
ncbi:phage major capsid protein [Acidaminococcus intestini]|uniref:phage major capsid protein n=1 Tax=Acidaminococcus intestini TaxID=187327 RepID=UPI0020616A02|nr:phage major capsid protein [Acidaminococcus intestini]DAS24288.1 MAG TPA: major capsid protein [Caudoviricetes sp.]